MKLTAEQLAEMLKQAKAAAGNTPTIESMRRDMEALGSTMPLTQSVVAHPIKLGGVQGIKFVPSSAPSNRHLLYFHGGGYCMGSPETHQGFTSFLAKSLDVVVWSMDYRLAPEHPFPAALNDGLNSYEALLEEVGSPNKIIVVGDSAGGGLAVATLIKARDSGLPMPSGAILLSPWSDLTASGRSHSEQSERDYVVYAQVQTIVTQAFLNGQASDNPFVSPALANLTGLPDLFIQVGSEELLLSDSIKLAEQAGIDRVSVDLQIWPGMPHVFQAYYQHVDQARLALKKMAVWISARVDD